ncbi:MAG: hypothetical protein M1368_04435, partial [Thaumarchaeota archaeon]|nr:hypothetical protein [Nitrososphaerota archaeon]
WRLNRIARDIGAFPLIGREPILSLAKELYSKDREKLGKIWFEGGVSAGSYFRMICQTFEEFASMLESLKDVLTVGRIEFKRDREDPHKFIFQEVTTLPMELNYCREQYFSGIFSALSAKVLDHETGPGTLQIHVETAQSIKKQL